MFAASLMPGVSRPGFETPLLVEHLPKSNCAVLDMGCGSGYVALAAARRGHTVTAADISPAACAATQEAAHKEGLALHVITSDLFSAINGRFDVIAFNPPYGSASSKNSATLEWMKSWLPRDNALLAEIAFWFVRKNRMQLIKRFLKGAAVHLTSQGRVLILLHHKEVDSILTEYKGSVVEERRWMRLVSIPASSFAVVSYA